MPRKGALGRIGGALLGLAVLPSLRRRSVAAAQVGPGVQVGTLAELTEKGRIVAAYRGLPVLVFDPTRDGTGKGVRVLSALCTHEFCVVDWNAEAGTVLCPCHGGTFDAAGSVITGPPPSALLSFSVRVEDGKIFVVEE